MKKYLVTRTFKKLMILKMKSCFLFHNTFNFIAQRFLRTLTLVKKKKAKKELQRSFALFMNKENSEDVKNKMFDRLVIVHTYTK